MKTTKLIACGLLVAGLLLAGCESVQPRPALEGNVLAHIGQIPEVSDTAILVEGQPAFNFGEYNRSLWLTHQKEFEYGGIGSFETDRLRSESWYFRFSHREGPWSPDVPFVDHGDVHLADTVLWKTRSDNYIGYGTSSYGRTHYLEGSSVTFTEASHLEAILARKPIPVYSTGSDRATSLAAVFTPRRSFTLTGVRSGTDLDFRWERPVVSAREGLVLEFDRVLDHESLYITLISVPRATGASGWMQLVETSSRIVIPPNVLEEMLSAYEAAGGTEEAEYVFFLSEYHTDFGLIAGELLPEEEAFALDFVQQNSLGMNLWLTP